MFNLGFLMFVLILKGIYFIRDRKVYCEFREDFVRNFGLER